MRIDDVPETNDNGSEDEDDETLIGRTIFDKEKSSPLTLVDDLVEDLTNDKDEMLI